jgi:predicted neuraminidase
MLLALLASSALLHLVLLKSEFIYESAPYPSCHASTIVEISPGHLAAAWFGGSAEGNPDVCIYLSRCGPDGKWGEPVKVADGITRSVPPLPRGGCPASSPLRGSPRVRERVGVPRELGGVNQEKLGPPLVIPQEPSLTPTLARRSGEDSPSEGENAFPSSGPATNLQTFPCYNPVLFKPRHMPLMLFYKVGPSPARWWGMVKTSRDGGKRWTEARRLPEGFFGPVKNKPVELEDGTLVCPSSSEANGWKVQFESTPDLGATWFLMWPESQPSGVSAIQPSLLRLGDGRLRAIGRTKQGRLFAVDQVGISSPQPHWGPMRLLDVPNPDSGIDAVTLRDGRHLLIYNPTTKGRTPLAVAISGDAEQWRQVLSLEDAPGEYSYPAVIQTSDGLINITYTWQRKRIKHVVLDPKSNSIPE